VVKKSGQHFKIIHLKKMFGFGLSGQNINILFKMWFVRPTQLFILKMWWFVRPTQHLKYQNPYFYQYLLMG